MHALLEALEVDHVGIAAAGAGSDLSRLLGAAEVEGRQMPSGVAVGRFGPGRRLELVWEAREGSPVAGFLRRRGPGLHHVALRVEAPIEELRERLASASVPLIGEAIESAADGRKCFFVHPSGTGGVLVEVVEGEPRG
jgi:methylmalonyl-CoA epimerase